MPVAKTNDELTELEVIEPERIDGVSSGATGFPMLLMKSVPVQTTGYDGVGYDEEPDASEDEPVKGENTCPNCGAVLAKAVGAQGGVNEKPDIAAAEGILQDIARLIQSEAAEMAVGNWDEQYDIQLLSEAASLVSCFRSHEMWGDEDDGDEYVTKEDLSAFLAKRKVSSAERKRLASEDKALSDGSYPIDNAEDLGNAATLARSGHGDVAAAKRLIAKRARELGVANPLAGKAEKDTTSAGADPQDAPVEKADVIKAAITEAISPLKDDLEAVKADMAKVLAMPIPGGPVQTVPATIRAQRKRDEELAKAARYERMAEEVSEPDIRNHYQRLAAEARTSAADTSALR